jgi:hypothetical protein
MWTRMALAVLAAAVLAACKREASGGMPPVSEWKPPAPKPSVVEGGRRGKGTARGSASHALGADPDDPHAGLDVDEPEGDEDEEGEPAGAEEAADEADENPHGDDEAQMAPRETLARGQIRAGGEAEAVVKPGTVLYVSAVPVGADDRPAGSAVAVERFEIAALPMPFELKGGRFQGDVLITAWTDADGEARTRQAGDAEGQVKARLPADGVDLVLDRVLK